MPDIYSLSEVDEADFITALAINRGYPAYMGRAVGLLAQFPSMLAATAWLGYTFTDTLVNLMDVLHSHFGPSKSFMEDLRFAESPAFDLPEEAIYVEFDRFASCGRMTLMLLVGLITKLGGGQLLVALGSSWLKKMAIDAKFDGVHDKLDEIAARQRLADPSGEVSSAKALELNMRIGNIERYLHLLGDAMREDTRKYNDELIQRSWRTPERLLSQPEWPEY